MNLNFLAGSWVIHGKDGAIAGPSVIEAEWPGAVLFERRRIGDAKPQPLWLVNSEATGWKQLFVAVTEKIREFHSVSPAGKRPLVLEGEFVLQDGTPARFRMAIEHGSNDFSRRRLQMSVDGGDTWRSAFDYTYTRAR